MTFQDDGLADYDELAAWAREQSALWADRTQDPSSIVIAPQSALGLDKELPGGMTPARFAWRALGTAGEHIAAAEYILASGGGVMAKPFATLSRTSMLGAARALYILEEDSAETRRIRSLQFLRKEADDASKLIENSRGFSSTNPDRATFAAARLKAAYEKELEALGLKPGSTISESRLLTSAATHLATPPNSLAAIMHLWNYMSGTAHARSWPWDSGQEDKEYIVQYVTTWSITLGLMDAAWTLWNQRRYEAVA